MKFLTKKKHDNALRKYKRVSLHRSKVLERWVSEKSDQDDFSYPCRMFFDTDHKHYDIMPYRAIFPYNHTTGIDIFPSEIRSFDGEFRVSSRKIINCNKRCRYIIITNMEAINYAEAFLIIDKIDKLCYCVEVGAVKNSVTISHLRPVISIQKRKGDSPQIIYCEELNNFKINDLTYHTTVHSLYDMAEALYTFGARFPALIVLKDQFTDWYAEAQNNS